MIEILNIGKVSRIKLHFTCRWCGCKFAADRADYEKRVVSWYKKPPGKDWIERYEYHTICPICGNRIYAQENEVEKWEYTDYGDGTESFYRVE